MKDLGDRCDQHFDCSLEYLCCPWSGGSSPGGKACSLATSNACLSVLRGEEGASNSEEAASLDNASADSEGNETSEGEQTAAEEVENDSAADESGGNQ